jgi:diadenylate cyclase
MVLFHIGFIPITAIDILDILAVSFLFYQLYKIMRGTRASQMFTGLIIIFVGAFIAQLLEMRGMTWIIQNIATVWVVAFVILFQPELRRLLIQMGESKLVRRFFRIAEVSKVLDAVGKAAEELSDKRFGALFVIQGDTGIESVIETGIHLRAEISSELLVSIFFPRSPLHDGAVVIANGMVEAAGCILPLTQNPRVETTMGMRHRAALGITEESDCAAVVVSEETGQISLARRGHFIHRNLNRELLTIHLTRIFSKAAPESAVPQSTPEGKSDLSDESESDIEPETPAI